MSTTNLTIHKLYDDKRDYKSLKITIEDEDHSSQIKFGEWIEAKRIEKQNDNEKSSRMVVKILTANEFNDFDLESCARSIDELDKYLNTNTTMDGINAFDVNDYKNTTNKSLYTKISIDASEDSIHNNYDLKNTEMNLVENPLEHSLEKIKENNARIMENIHMLNRTLNYTKKKEILSLMCPKPMRTYTCNTCGKCFVYETGLNRHHMIRHALSEIQPRWQTVWTCVQCFQVWPRQDQALKHSSVCCQSDNSDYIREIKTSSLLQCEFCEKVFTSIPRLLKHLKFHTTSSNYQCNACETSFASYKLAEQHWSGCSWQKFYYSFTLPKMLLCNVCDRKFRNYEQLYNHR